MGRVAAPKSEVPAALPAQRLQRVVSANAWVRYQSPGILGQRLKEFTL